MLVELSLFQDADRVSRTPLQQNLTRLALVGIM